MVRTSICSIAVFVLVACGSSSTSGSGGTGTSDGTAADTSAGPGSADADASDDGPTPGACDPGDLMLDPPCDNPPGSQIPITEAGCYQPCEVPEDCAEGTCATVWALPCEDPTSPGCTECGGGSRVCVDAPAVDADFPVGLTNHVGCFNGGAALNLANTMGLQVSAADAAQQMMDTGTTVMQDITLPSDTAGVTVSVGYGVSGSYCTDAALGWIVEGYNATAGTLSVTFEPPGPDDQHLGTLTASITNATVTNDDGDTLQIDSFDLGPVELWCCPG